MVWSLNDYNCLVLIPKKIKYLISIFKRLYLFQFLPFTSQNNILLTTNLKFHTYRFSNLTIKNIKLRQILSFRY